MTPENLDKWRIVPRIMMLALTVLTYKAVMWFMTLTTPTLEQTTLVSVMSATLTGAFGMFLGSGKKE